MLDIASLLQDISPDAPSGDNLEYDAAFIALEQKAKGTPEQQIGNRIEPAQPPNWREVQKESEALLRRTRDLRPMLDLIRALLHQHGLSGLRDGLDLLRGSVVDFWETLHPQLDPDDDNDPTQRVNLLMSLCDFESVLRPLASVPIVESRAIGRYSLRDVQIATGKLPAPTDGSEEPKLANIEAAFLETGIESLRAAEGDLGSMLASLELIEAYVTDRVGIGNAPSFAPLAASLKEIRQIFREQLSARGDDAESIATAEAGVEEAPAAVEAKAKAGKLDAINDRQDVIRALNLICDYYSKFEPSSPIPLFLQRAKRLVQKDFVEILKDLAPDGLSQIAVIKGPDADDTNK
ncbi:type VI secretion system protein TssA [Methylococcus sp. EFPC2]|nr:type VI secretion system protein TssA [Methylococcus sp. EFPC2]